MSELFTNYLTDLSDFLAFFVVSLFLVVVFVVVYTMSPGTASSS